MYTWPDNEDKQPVCYEHGVIDSCDNINPSAKQASEYFPLSIKVIALHKKPGVADGNWLWIEFPVTANKNVSDFIAARKRIIAKAGD